MANIYIYIYIYIFSGIWGIKKLNFLTNEEVCGTRSQTWDFKTSKFWNSFLPSSREKLSSLSPKQCEYLWPFLPKPVFWWQKVKANPGIWGDNINFSRTRKDTVPKFYTGISKRVHVIKVVTASREYRLCKKNTKTGTAENTQEPRKKILIQTKMLLLL